MDILNPLPELLLILSIPRLESYSEVKTVIPELLFNIKFPSEEIDFVKPSGGEYELGMEILSSLLL